MQTLPTHRNTHSELGRVVILLIASHIYHHHIISVKHELPSHQSAGHKPCSIRDNPSCRQMKGSHYSFYRKCTRCHGQAIRPIFFSLLLHNPFSMSHNRLKSFTKSFSFSFFSPLSPLSLCNRFLHTTTSFLGKSEENHFRFLFCRKYLFPASLSSA